MSVKRTVASTRSGSGTGRVPGQELLDLVDDLVRVPGGDPVVRAGELDELRARDPRCEIAALCHIHVVVAPAVEDERRDADRRQHLPTSMYEFIRRRAAAAPGLAERRRYCSRFRVNCSSPTRLGA
jgi:hypothetical protein